MTRRISSSRPMTGSSLPCSASAVRSRPNFSSAWYLSSARLVGHAVGPRTSPIALSSAPCWRRRRAARRPPARGGGEREQQVLGGDVLVLERRASRSSASRRTRTSSLDGPAASPPALSGRQRVEQRRWPRCADGGGVGAELGQHGRDDAAVLLEQDDEQVLGRHLRVAAALGELAGGGDRLLGLDGESISLHKKSQSGETQIIAHGDLALARPRPDGDGRARVCPPMDHPDRRPDHRSAGRGIFALNGAMRRNVTARHDSLDDAMSDENEPLPSAHLIPDDETAAGDTPEAHDEINPHDLPPGPSRPPGGRGEGREARARTTRRRPAATTGPDAPARRAGERHARPSRGRRAVVRRRCAASAATAPCRRAVASRSTRMRCRRRRDVAHADEVGRGAVGHELGPERTGAPARPRPPSPRASRGCAARAPRAAGVARSSCSSSTSTRSTPARLSPSSFVISWMRRRRSTSACEYRRVPFGERLGSMSPRVSYMRSVCGCMSASSAATEIMNTPRSWSTVTRVVVRAAARHHDPPRACANSFARGLPFITCDSFSTASDCSVLRLAGTSMTKR